MKFESELITFTEIPDEISLCFNISNCPCRCEGCFEPWLREDIGEELTFDIIREKIAKHPHITCICFMGGDANHKKVYCLGSQIKLFYPHLKVAMYSGLEKADEVLLEVLDYYKLGPYIPKFGPLNLKTTNQKLWKKNGND